MTTVADKLAETTSAIDASVRSGTEILVMVDLNELPPSVIGQYCAAIDSMHRALGGPGLRLKSSSTEGNVYTAVLAPREAA